MPSQCAVVPEAGVPQDSRVARPAAAVVVGEEGWPVGAHPRIGGTVAALTAGSMTASRGLPRAAAAVATARGPPDPSAIAGK